MNSQGALPSLNLPSWLGVIAAQRVAALLLLRPGGFFYDYSDFHTYRFYAQWMAEGFLPFRDYWMEYPPLFPLLNQAVYALSLRFPPLADGRFWHHLLLGLALLPFDLAVAALLARLAARLGGAERATWTLAVWALLFAPLFLWQGFFDSMALAALLVAVWAMVERRPGWAGAALAFGFATKLLPVIALPAALWTFARRGVGWRGLFSRANGQMLLTFGVGVAAVVGPLLWIGPEWLAATGRAVVGRGAWQTVWALADGFYGYGLVPGDRFDPNPAFEAAPSRVPWPLVHAAFGAASLWAWTRRWRWERPGVPVAFVAATLFAFLLWSKGWSPQFTLYLVPFVLLLLPDARGVATTLALTFLMGWETIFFARWSAHPWMLVAIVLARAVILVALTALALARLRAWSRPTVPTSGT